jgi:hypothetical protein
MERGSEPGFVEHSGSDLAKVALDAFRARQASPPANELRAGAPVSVTRLDRQTTYVLVPIEDATGLRGVVQVNPKDLSLESLSDVRDPRSEFLSSADSALSAAKAALPMKHDWATPFLGWRPSRESFESTRPFWVVPHSDGTAFVTQSLHVFEALTAGRGG